MAENTGVIGLGTLIKIGDGASPEEFTTIPNVTSDISGPTIGQDFADFTHMESTGGFRERKATFKTGGQVTFTCTYENGNTQHEALVTAALANPATLTNFTITYPDTSAAALSAYVSVNFNSAKEGGFDMIVTLDVEGAWSLS